MICPTATSSGWIHDSPALIEPGWVSLIGCAFLCAGHAEVVKLLVKANALVDKANQKGTTALMRATQEGNEEVVGILVSAGADVSKRNNERMNALMLGSQVRRLVAGHFHYHGCTMIG